MKRENDSGGRREKSWRVESRRVTGKEAETEKKLGVEDMETGG